MRRVVVTGLGLLTTLGNDYKNSWNNLISGFSGIRKITQFEDANNKNSNVVYYFIIYIEIFLNWHPSTK